jgi:CheY-like chemotaxis protein
MHPAAIQSRPLVVVADDSSDMRSLIKEVLEGDGYEVIPAASGARALTEMTARRPDLLITDLLMPGMTGFILRGLMLRRPELASIPVIILSAYWHPAQRYARRGGGPDQAAEHRPAHRGGASPGAHRRADADDDIGPDPAQWARDQRAGWWPATAEAEPGRGPTGDAGPLGRSSFEVYL